MLAGPSFRSAFVFSINSLISSGFPLTSFHLAETFLTAFSWLYTLVCAVVHKILRNVFIYNYSQLQDSFCNQLALFAQLENVNKLQNNNRTVHVKERNQNKNKTKSCHIQVDHTFYCSIQPTNNAIVLLGGFTGKDGWSWHKSNFLSYKKIKIGRPEHLLTPHPPTSDNIYFCFNSSPSKWTSYVHHL